METAFPMTLDIPLAPMVFPSVGQPEREQVQRKLWTREEYYRLGEQGWFNDQKTELIEGEIIVLPPISHDHCDVIENIKDALAEAFGDDVWIRSQYPLPVSSWSEPQPDVSVADGHRKKHKKHPQESLLAVEVSRTTLKYDLEVKPALYALAGVKDYWVVDLKGRALIVHREPVTESPGKARYAKITTLSETESVAPLATPNALIRIADLLPAKD